MVLHYTYKRVDETTNSNGCKLRMTGLAGRSGTVCVRGVVQKRDAVCMLCRKKQDTGRRGPWKVEGKIKRTLFCVEGWDGMVFRYEVIAW